MKKVLDKIGRKEIVIAIGLVLLALGIRIYNLEGHSLYIDEILWMGRGKQIVFAYKQLNMDFFRNGGWWFLEKAASLGIPMGFLVGLVEVLFVPNQSSFSLGWLPDITGARLPAVIVGSFFVGVTYWLVQKENKLLALTVGLMLLVDPLSVHLSRWAHQDMFLAVTSFLSVVLFIKAENKWWFAISGLFLALAALTKPQAVLIPITTLVFVLTGKNRVGGLKKWFGWAVFGVVLTSLLFPYLWPNPVANYLKYVFHIGREVNVGHLNIFAGEVTPNPPPYYYLVTGPLHMPEGMLVGLILAIIGAGYWIKKGRVNISGIDLAGMVYVTTYLLIMSFSEKKLGVRYIYPIWPYLIYWAAKGWLMVIRRVKASWKGVVLGAALLPSIWGLVVYSPNYYLYHNSLISSQKDQWLELVGVCDGVKPAIEYLGERVKDSKLMLLSCGVTAQYYSGYRIDYTDKIEDVNEVDYIVAEPQQSTRYQINEGIFLENGFRLEKEIEFAGFKLARIYSRDQ